MNKLIPAILATLIILSCASMETPRKENTGNLYTFQKTYYLRQMPADFIPYYNVWKTFPVEFTSFPTLQERKDAKLFTARQKISMIGNDFIIKDNVEKQDYLLQQIFDPSSDTLEFKLLLKDREIAHYQQYEKNNLLEFSLIIGNQTYAVNGKKLETERKILQGFSYDISRDNIFYGHIYKPLTTMSNQCDIVVNRAYKDIQPIIFISTGIMLTTVLKDAGYQYK